MYAEIPQVTFALGVMCDGSLDVAIIAPYLPHDLSLRGKECRPC